MFPNLGSRRDKLEAYPTLAHVGFQALLAGVGVAVGGLATRREKLEAYPILAASRNAVLRANGGGISQTLCGARLPDFLLYYRPT